MKIIFLDLEGVVVSHKTILLNTGDAGAPGYCQPGLSLVTTLNVPY